MDRHSASTAWAGLVAMALTMTVAGCDANPKRPVYSASGKLIIGGKAAGGAHVVLHPLDPGQIARAAAITQRDGSFQLTTYRVGDGAPPGEYVATIYWPDDSIPFDDCAGDDLVQHDRLCGLYFKASTSPLRVTIGARSNEIELEAADLSALLRKPTPLHTATPAAPVPVASDR